MKVVFLNFATKLTTECAKLGHRFKINTKNHEFTPFRALQYRFPCRNQGTLVVLRGLNFHR